MSYKTRFLSKIFKKYNNYIQNIKIIKNINEIEENDLFFHYY